MRTALAIILGIIVAFAVQAGVDWLNSLLYPYPLTDMWDRQQVSEAFAARPTAALLLLILGYFLGGLAGAMTGKSIRRRNWAGWIPAGVLAATALLLALSYSFPTWTWLGMFAAPLIAGLIANHLIASREAEILDDPAPIDADI